MLIDDKIQSNRNCFTDKPDLGRPILLIYFFMSNYALLLQL